MNKTITDKIKQILNDEDEKDKDKKEEKDISKKSADEILDDLKGIEKDFNSPEVDAPSSLNLKKLEQNEMSEEELENKAKENIDNDYNNRKNKTTTSYDQKIQDKNQYKETAKQNSASRQESITKNYDESIKATNNDAIRRGLSRSSIVISEIAELQKGKAEDLTKEMQDLQSKLDATENDIISLENEKNQALENLDIEYALEVEKQLSKVKEDYLKQQQDIIEFNNNVDKLEAEYKLKLDKQKTDKQKEMASIRDKYGATYYTNLIVDKQYEYLKNYLSGLDKNYALSLLTSRKEFKNILGSRYNELYEEIRKK